VTKLRAEGGLRALRISHVAHPDLRFPTPSGRIEVRSEYAQSLGLPALPAYEPLPKAPAYPLAFRQGRTLTQFHAFYDQGRALPTLARLDSSPQLCSRKPMPRPVASSMARRSASTTSAARCAAARMSPIEFRLGQCGCETVGSAEHGHVRRGGPAGRRGGGVRVLRRAGGFRRGRRSRAGVAKAARIAHRWTPLLAGTSRIAAFSA